MTKNFPSLMPNAPSLIPIVAAALAEDIGTGDITSQLLIPENAQGEMLFVARENLVVCGAFIPAEVYRQLNTSVIVEMIAQEGHSAAKGTVLATARGPARALLAGERVALNLMQRMCGVATLTRAYADAVRGTKAVILDTRKTMPGLRLLDKYAVRTGGGQNHRLRLDDMVLIKDNHLALRMQDSGFRLQRVVDEVRKKLSSLNPDSRILIPIVIECDTLAQVAQALEARPDRILLDNMDNASLHQAVALAAGRVPLEASGGVSLSTVRGIAETGVDYISVGAITHSPPAVDIGADITMSASPCSA